MGILFGGAASAAESIYLRCIYADTINQRGGRYVIATIDPSGHQIRFDDHHAGGTTERTFTLENLGNSEVKGTRITDQGNQEVMVIDRLSGRMTLYHDGTRDADRLWNDKKQQIGGFDLKKGERLWFNIPLDCEKTEPVL